MNDPRRDALDDKYWREIKDKSAFAGITLDDTITLEDFATYGQRIAGRQLEMLRRVGGPPLERSSILDVGVGVGRQLKPFSDVFARAVGVDINERALDTARDYIGERENVELIRNDGKTLPFVDNSFDYVYSGGVLQHIPDIGIVMGYFREGLRVLKPGGVLNFSIMVWMTSRIGGVHGDRVGAKVVSADIDALLNETGHEFLAIFNDPKDPVPHFNILIRKLPSPYALAKVVKRKLQPLKLTHAHVTDMPVRTGIFEDLPSYTTMREQWAGKRRQVTFFWKPH